MEATMTNPAAIDTPAPIRTEVDWVVGPGGEDLALIARTWHDADARACDLCPRCTAQPIGSGRSYCEVAAGASALPDDFAEAEPAAAGYRSAG